MPPLPYQIIIVAVFWTVSMRRVYWVVYVLEGHVGSCDYEKAKV